MDQAAWAMTRGQMGDTTSIPSKFDTCDHLWQPEPRELFATWLPARGE
jgi:hypothetical protein